MPNRFLFALAALLFSVCVPRAGLAAPVFEIDRPVMFGGRDSDSNAFHAPVARLIRERGHCCETVVLPLSMLPLVAGLAQGDIPELPCI